MPADSELAKLASLGKQKPETLQAFADFDMAAMADGAVPKKYKELAALAVALTTQCQYCLEVHSDFARQAGATDEELTEIIFVAAALRAGAAVTHGANHIVS